MTTLPALAAAGTTVGRHGHRRPGLAEILGRVEPSREHAQSAIA
ncbi:MAG: hypothetical protein ABI369_08220 [Acetobacteraceae bacterium]